MMVFGQKQMTEDIYTHFKISSYDTRSKELEGSMYINEEPEVAKLTDVEQLYALRFNAYVNEMEFEREGKTYFLQKKYNSDVTFQQSGKTYRVFSYDKKNQKELGYFVVLHSGEKLYLLAMERIQYFEMVKPSSGYEKYKPPTLKRVKDKMYIGYPNHTTAELPTKKRDILQLFGSKSSEIESYAKKNRLSFKKGDDLASMFAYYDTLN
jgi:hypothetical protein